MADVPELSEPLPLIIVSNVMDIVLIARWCTAMMLETFADKETLIYDES